MSKIVCPWWLGYLLINPYRKRKQDPEKITGPYLKPGMKVIDYGSAMGFFSLPMASIVGNSGKVYCFDIQKKMLDKLMKRATKASLEKIIETVLICDDEKMFERFYGLADFILLYAVAHEVPDKEKLFINLFKMIKNGGKLLFGEPSGHVNKKAFSITLSRAEKAGFIIINTLDIKSSHSVLLGKNHRQNY